MPLSFRTDSEIEAVWLPLFLGGFREREVNVRNNCVFFDDILPEGLAADRSTFLCGAAGITTPFSAEHRDLHLPHLRIRTCLLVLLFFNGTGKKETSSTQVLEYRLDRCA